MITSLHRPRLLISGLAEDYDDIFRCWRDLDRKALTREEILGYVGDLTLPSRTYKVKGRTGRSSEEIRLDHIKRVRRCMINPEKMPPLDVYQTTRDGFILYDGHHRLLAAHILGWESVPIQWRGMWNLLCVDFPNSFKAGLLPVGPDGPLGGAPWRGRKSFELRAQRYPRRWRIRLCLAALGVVPDVVTD